MLTCRTPAHNQSDFEHATVTRIEVSINGQQYFASDAMAFRYYHPPVLKAVSPSTGPSAGASSVLISFDGAGTTPHAAGTTLCRFADTVVSASIVGDADDKLRCARTRRGRSPSPSPSPSP